MDNLNSIREIISFPDTSEALKNSLKNFLEAVKPTEKTFVETTDEYNLRILKKKLEIALFTENYDYADEIRRKIKELGCE
jgi:hypothetical protein